jgi:hypothetical protein
VFPLHISVRRCMHGQKLRAILAMSHEEHSMLCGLACRTNESVVLEITDHRIVRDHVGQDQLSAACPTMHRSHVYRTPPVARVIDIGATAVQVRLWICLRRRSRLPRTRRTRKNWLDATSTPTPDTPVRSCLRRPAKLTRAPQAGRAGDICSLARRRTARVSPRDGTPNESTPTG